MPRYSLKGVIDEYRKEEASFTGDWEIELTRRLDQFTRPVDVLYRAIKLFDSGKHDRGERLLETWQKSFEGDATIYNLRAVLQENKGDHDKARDLYQEGRRIDPTDTDLMQNLFSFLLSRGETESALDVVGDIITLEPEPIHYINRAALRIRMGREGYLDDFREAFKLDPNSTENYISEMGRAAIENRSHLDKMVGVMEMCIDGRPAGTDIYLQLAHVYLLLNKQVDAKRTLEVGIDAAQSDADARILATNIALLDGNYTGALMLVEVLPKRTGFDGYKDIEEAVRGMLESRKIKEPPKPKMNIAEAVMTGSIIEMASKPKSEGTFQRNGEKPKRNDPCSCGSGKKFKKCCGNC